MKNILAVSCLVCTVMLFAVGCAGQGEEASSSSDEMSATSAIPEDQEQVEQSSSKKTTEPLVVFVGGYTVGELGYTIDLSRVEMPTELLTDPNHNPPKVYEVNHYDNQFGLTYTKGDVSLLVVDLHENQLAVNPIALRVYQAFRVSDFVDERYVAPIGAPVGKQLFTLEQLRELQVGGDEQVMICDITEYSYVSESGSYDNFEGFVETVLSPDGVYFGYDYDWLLPLYDYFSGAMLGDIFVREDR